jgi:hypothetical protein
MGAPSLQEQYTFSIFCFVPHKILEEGLAECVPSHSSPSSARTPKREKDETAGYFPLDYFCRFAMMFITCQYRFYAYFIVRGERGRHVYIV